VTLDPTGHAIDCEAELVGLYLDWPRQYAPMLALKHARFAQEIGREMDTPRYHLHVACLLARALHANNQLSEALEHSRRALQHAQMLDLPTVRFDAIWTHGLMLWAIQESAPALEMLQEAQRTAEGYDDHAAAQRVGLDIDRLTGNLESARERLAFFEGLNLHNFSYQTRVFFPTLVDTNEQPVNLEPSTIRLELLGAMRLRHEAKLEPIRGRKRQELLALLIEARIAGRNEIPKLELIDQLYTDSTEAQAAASLKDLAHQIRTMYGQDLIVTTGNGYALGPVKTDVETYLETNDVQLWHGPYLSGPEDGLRPGLHASLLEHARLLLETQPEETLRLGRILLEQDPFDLEAMRLTARALQICQPKQLEPFYRLQRKRWLELGETLPERAQDFLTINF
jgi:hypothetical protein